MIPEWAEGGTFGPSPPFRLIRVRSCSGIQSQRRKAVVEEGNGLLEDPRRDFATFVRVRWERRRW